MYRTQTYSSWKYLSLIFYGWALHYNLPHIYIHNALISIYEKKNIDGSETGVVRIHDFMPVLFWLCDQCVLLVDCRAVAELEHCYHPKLGEQDSSVATHFIQLTKCSSTVYYMLACTKSSAWVSMCYRLDRVERYSISVYNNAILPALNSNNGP
jgi:hypothetical protein